MGTDLEVLIAGDRQRGGEHADEHGAPRVQHEVGGGSYGDAARDGRVLNVHLRTEGPRREYSLVLTDL